MAEAKVHHALRKLVQILDGAVIPYAIAGAMALNQYGYQRVTVGIDVLLTASGLENLKRRVIGLGYVEKYPGSRGLRDTENGVVIDVLVAGEFPGDGEPKPVAFPDPATLGDQARPFLPLAKLVELKLASGISAPHRLKDLADVLELVRAASLPRNLADELNPWVRDKYFELWDAAQVAERE